MPDGTASEIAVVKTCFLADAGAAHGLVSNQVGNCDYPPAGFMLAMDADPLAGNTSANVSGIVLQSDCTNFEVFDVFGKVNASTKNMSGTWVCDPNTSG
jgi:hypothetical protein